MKSIRPVQISGIGCYVPERVLTNHDLSKIVDTSDEWILQRTGISERRIVDKGKATSDMAEQAVRRLCNSLQMDPNEIELLIVATVTPDMFFPSTACLLQEKLGIKQTWGFDLSAACCGFVYSLSVGLLLSPRACTPKSSWLVPIRCRALSTTRIAPPASFLVMGPGPCCWNPPGIRRIVSSIFITKWMAQAECI